MFVIVSRQCRVCVSRCVEVSRPGLLTSLVPVASGYMFDWDLLLHVTFVPLTCLPVKGGTLKRF